MIDKDVLIQKLDSILKNNNNQRIMLKALKLKDKLKELDINEKEIIVFSCAENTTTWKRDIKHINKLYDMQLITKEEARKRLRKSILNTLDIKNHNLF